MIKTIAKSLVNPPVNSLIKGTNFSSWGESCTFGSYVKSNFVVDENNNEFCQIVLKTPSTIEGFRTKGEFKPVALVATPDFNIAELLAKELGIKLFVAKPILRKVWDLNVFPYKDICDL